MDAKSFKTSYSQETLQSNVSLVSNGLDFLKVLSSLFTSLMERTIFHSSSALTNSSFALQTLAPARTKRSTCCKSMNCFIKQIFIMTGDWKTADFNLQSYVKFPIIPTLWIPDFQDSGGNSYSYTCIICTRNEYSACHPMRRFSCMANNIQ